MTIVFITTGYPSKAKPTLCAFVKEEAFGLAGQNVRCIIINPISWWHKLRCGGFPYHEVETSCGRTVEVFRPSFMSWPPWFDKFGFLRKLKFMFFWHRVLSTVKKYNIKPDALLGQFLYYGGGAALNVGQRIGIPAFVEVGEGRLAVCHRTFSLDYMRRHIKGIAHFICNGTHLKEILMEKFSVDANKISVLPNGIDVRTFSPRDKKTARQQLGIPEDKYVVCSIGNYLYDKGVCRVAEAIRNMDGVIGVFAGSGPCPPVGHNVFISKRFKHEELPDLLAASDVFVLPTLVEGCCNAIQEAMSCGKAIIGPNTIQTADLIDNDCAITVDPLNIESIRDAIMRLRADKELSAKIASEALARSKKFAMDERVLRLLSIINNEIASAQSHACSNIPA